MKAQKEQRISSTERHLIWHQFLASDLLTGGLKKNISPKHLSKGCFLTIKAQVIMTKESCAPVQKSNTRS